MTWQLSLVVLFGLTALFLASGLWTAFALGLAGLVVIYLNGGSNMLSSVSSIGWNMSTSFLLTAVPLFILMGQMIFVSGLSKDLFTGIQRWLTRVPGGLLPGGLLACSIFAATTGSSVATAAAVGGVALPEMRRSRYDLGLASGTLAAGGSLGILIPPSITLIIYGAMANESIVALFAAALLPGVILAGLFIIYACVRTMVNPRLAGHGATQQFELGPALRSLPVMLPVFGLIALVLGTIYLGVATPTEAAAFGATGATLIAAPRLNLQLIRQSLIRTVEVTAMVLSIMLGAQIATFAIVDSGANRALTQAMIDLHLPRPAFLLLTFLLYIVLGDFVDGISMMLLTLPLLLPVVDGLGINLIWFGVVVSIFIELGQITPPVGLNLFVLQGLDKDVTHGRVIRGALPYAGIIIAFVLLLTIFPGIALWLANRTSH